MGKAKKYHWVYIVDREEAFLDLNAAVSCGKDKAVAKGCDYVVRPGGIYKDGYLIVEFYRDGEPYYFIDADDYCSMIEVKPIVG